MAWCSDIGLVLVAVAGKHRERVLAGRTHGPVIYVVDTIHPEFPEYAPSQCDVLLRELVVPRLDCFIRRAGAR